MNKTDMIKILVKDEDNSFTSKGLNKLNKDNVQEIFESLYDIEYEDFTNELPTKGLVYSEDYVEDPTIERTLIDKLTPSDEEIINSFAEEEEVEEEEVEEVEEVVIDISKLSVVEQRQYRRTGILPQITINRYTRFDDETPKMDS